MRSQSKSQKIASHRIHYTLLSKSNNLAGGRWRFPLKPQNVPFCGRNESFSNQVLSTLGWARSTLTPTRMDLFNLTSGRDASYPYLISTWPKEGCTIVCGASLKNCVCMHYCTPLVGPSALNQKGEGGGFSLNPKMHLFMGWTNLSPIRYCSLWEWAEESIPPLRICSISQRGETPHTLAL